MAHKQFQAKFKELSLSLSEVEQKIDCPKNYLSQFINGSRELPKKWENKITEFLDGIKKTLAKLEAPPPNPDLLRPWIKQVEEYCKTIGKDPEGLIEDHKALAGFKRITEAAVGAGKVKIQNLNPDPIKDNHSINARSDWMAEQRKKKCGF